tara:strand:+ start:634 stop:750 length:117 start_codon:yes stop_codon:yes gene_type:complete
MKRREKEIKKNIEVDKSGCLAMSKIINRKKRIGINKNL